MESTGGGAQKSVRPKTAVSLLSGSTEAIFALGLEAQLVGRSHECDYPAEAVGKLPACSIALVDHLEPAASIDAQVKKLSETGAPLYTLEAATVGALAPDVVFVQDSCRICAVSPSALQGVELAECEVVVLRPRTLQDVLDDIVTVASALGHRSVAWSTWPTCGHASQPSRSPSQHSQLRRRHAWLFWSGWIR
jgi:iron complex transport system substrate-binding protein